MKGLIYRILVMSRKTIISGFAVMIAFMILGMLFGASWRFGNLRLIIMCLNEDAKEADIYENAAALAKSSVYMVLFGVLAVLSQSISTVAEDAKTKWRSFAYTLPVTPRQTEAAAYIVMLIEYAAAFLLFMLGTLIIHSFFGMPLTLKDTGTYITIMLAGFIAMLILHNAALRFGGEQKALLILFTSVYGGIILLIILCMILTEVLPAEIASAIVRILTGLFHIIRGSMFLFPVYIAIAAAICFHRSVELTGRREK